MDTVGNVLEERRHEGFSWGVGISLAAILHTALFAGFILSSISRRGPFINPRAVSVRILPAGSLRGRAAAPSRSAPETKKILKPADPEEPPPPSEKAVLLPAPEEKKKASPSSPAPAPREEKEKGPDLSLPSGDDQAPGTSQAPAGAGGNVGVGGARFDQADFTYDYYVARMLIAIGTNWFRPAQAGGVAPVIHFRIERDGTITDPAVEKSSGLPFVDRAAMRAILSSSPLPPLPAEYGGAHLGVHLKFE